MHNNLCMEFCLLFNRLRGILSALGRHCVVWAVYRDSSENKDLALFSQGERRGALGLGKIVPGESGPTTYVWMGRIDGAGLHRLPGVLFAGTDLDSDHAAVN